MEGVTEKSISHAEDCEKSTAIFKRWTKGYKQREKRTFNVTAKQPSEEQKVHGSSCVPKNQKIYLIRKLPS